MKKVLSLLLVATLCLTVLLVGCDNKEDSTNTGKSTNTTESSSTDKTDSKDEKEPVDIRVAFYAGPTAAEKMYEIIDDFQAEFPHITVETTASEWGGHYEKLKAQLAAKAGPTVYLLDGPYIPQYAGNGVLEDLTDRVNQDIQADKYYGIDTITDPNGTIWGLPQGIQVNVMFYNKDMFDKAGVAYPTLDWTTDDVMTAAKKLTNDEHWGIGLPVHIRYGWYTTIRQFGGDTLDETRTKSTILTDPNVKKALEYMHDAWFEYNVSPTRADMEGELGTKYNTYFPREKVAMFYDCYQMQLTADEAGINYDVQVVPKGANKEGQHYSSFVANCWVLNARAKDEEKEGGWEFIKYYLGDEAQTTHAELGESLPANKQICNDVILNMPGGAEHKKVFLDSMEYAGTLGENAVWEEWFVTFQTVIGDYFSNKISIDEALEQADKEVQKVLDEYYQK